MPQRQLAIGLGVSATTINNWFHDRTSPRLNEVRLLVDFTDGLVGPTDFVDSLLFARYGVTQKNAAAFQGAAAKSGLVHSDNTTQNGEHNG